MAALNIEMRLAQPQDCEAIARHNVAMALETEAIKLEPDVVKAGVANALNDPTKGFYVVAETAGSASKEVIGNLMITFEWSDWRNRNMWWFQSVYVQREYRGQGIFRRMYEWVQERAKQEGVGELRLYVEHSNTSAQAVYAALGFQESHYRMYEVQMSSSSSSSSK